eukprot:scaffold21755_cov123-Isochrysis_galbana.AAC.1
MWPAALTRRAMHPAHHVRSLCAGTASENPIERMLKLASRPKMGLAKAKQSAGQRAIDLTKYTSNRFRSTGRDCLGGAAAFAISASRWLTLRRTASNAGQRRQAK